MENQYQQMLLQALMEQTAETIQPEEKDEMAMKTPEPMQEMMQMLMMMNQGQ